MLSQLLTQGLQGLVAEPQGREVVPRGSTDTPEIREGYKSELVDPHLSGSNGPRTTSQKGEVYFFFFLLGPQHMELPGQGSDPSSRLNLSYSCTNAGS